MSDSTGFTNGVAVAAVQSSSSPPSTYTRSFNACIIAGASAGFAVDTSLFPLDTIKTRLQSKNGFMKSGGFHGLFAGLKSVAIGSAPGSALFFASYETIKKQLQSSSLYVNDKNNVQITVVASAVSEITACVVRVPTENIKQRMQAGLASSTSKCIEEMVSSRGFSSFYTGFFATLLREIPFTIIQMPLYEFGKRMLVAYNNKNNNNTPAITSPSPLACACIGSISGAIGGAASTPFDVVKTRLMLSDTRISITHVVTSIYKHEGVGKFFSGIVPRTMWIGIGGFVFFGAYETTHHLLRKHHEK